MQAVVRICSRLSPWLLAHLPDLLLRSPVAEAVLLQELPHLACTQVPGHCSSPEEHSLTCSSPFIVSMLLHQVEFFRLEYASSLLGNPTAWHLAAVYLAWCPRHGQAALTSGLKQIAASADRATAARLLGLCGKYGLEDVAALTRRVQAAKARAVGCFLSCLMHRRLTLQCMVAEVGSCRRAIWQMRCNGSWPTGTWQLQTRRQLASCLWWRRRLLRATQAAWRVSPLSPHVALLSVWLQKSSS